MYTYNNGDRFVAGRDIPLPNQPVAMVTTITTCTIIILCLVIFIDINVCGIYKVGRPILKHNNINYCGCGFIYTELSSEFKECGYISFFTFNCYIQIY